MYKYCERIKPVQCPIQRVPVWCEGMTAYSDLHSGVAALKASRCGRAGPLQLFEVGFVRQIGVVPRVASPPDSYALFGGFYYTKGGRQMKKAIGYLSLGAAVFLFSLLMLYIGFISPANSGAQSPFIRMTACTVICIAAVGLFTRYIHFITALAGLDSANLNLFFTAAILLSLFVQFAEFGGSPVGPYMEGLAQKGGRFYSCIKYVFMGGQALIGTRTFIHSAFLGLLKAIMKHG